MHIRCYNPKNVVYRYYGGRGVTVCDRWHSFEEFLADMGERPSRGHSIDRIDGNLGYEPGNCRWATRREQALNTSRVNLVEYNGAVMSLSELESVTGVSRHALRNRLRAGLAPEEAVKIERLPYTPRRVLGSSNPSSKLTEEAVAEIKARVAGGATQISMALKFGVCYSTISQIMRGKIWQHVTPRA